ncbi:MAG TPA: MliC family protein [Rhizomicrobium sp.]|jgi:membrane-bound inhibitor of C-type lysozyme|nr:MliC family protein [Rhizomicrobium sp.]
MRGVFFVMTLVIVATTAPAHAAAALYRCPLNVDIAAGYSADAKSVTLYAQGQTFHLPIAMSGSGARYSDGKTTIWEHQGTATFETPGASFTGCKAVPLNR